MGKTKQDTKECLHNLIDSVIDDIQEMPDEEVLKLAVDTFGDIEQVVTKFNSIVDQAEGIAKKRRFENAKNKLEAPRKSSNTSDVLALPMNKKREIIEMVERNKGITMLAARNSSNREADLDSELEDLIDLGLIDEHGNVL